MQIWIWIWVLECSGGNDENKGGMQGAAMTGELKDVLAGRTEDEEAMCAVCSGGLSIAPNLIVFCERCDIAVHQKCYGVDDIPAGGLVLGGDM